MLPQHRNSTNEQYTPVWLVDIARAILGNIELDPATSMRANRDIGASTIFTEKDNGLLQRWDTYSSIWLNPPGGVVDEDACTVIRASVVHRRQACSVTGACGLKPGHKHRGVTSSASRWWSKLAGWYSLRSGLGSPGSALYLMFSLEMLQSVQRYTCAHPLDFSICIFGDRLEFDTVQRGKRIKGDQPTHASALVLLSKREHEKSRFASLLAPKGKVIIR